MDNFSILAYAHESGKPAVLATLLHAEGHSYRKAGACMLLLSDGSRIGSLSPGCLESDLHERVGDLLLSGEAELIAYNLIPEEDAIWGQSMGCGGILQILLEPLGDAAMDLLKQAYLEVEAGFELEWLRYSSGRRIEYAVRSSIPGSNRDNAHSGNEWRNPLFSTRFAPRSRLFVFGADEGTIPIVRLARDVGFRVAVGDWRVILCNSQRYPNAELAVGSTEKIIAALNLSSTDYILICSHQIAKDREMLEGILPLKPSYLGIMGSASRIDRLLEGVPPMDFIHAPVGIAIGADGPEEIAVSITAQLIAVRKARRRERGVGGIAITNGGNLLGGWAEQQNDRSEAFFGACAR